VDQPEAVSQRFDLRRIPTALIVKHLADIATKEQVQVDAAALYAIARGADGGMRDAESTLDQLISFCGEKIEEADVLTMFGLTAQGQILELSRAVLAGEIHTALNELNDLAQKGKDLGRLLSDLLSHFRNLILFQVSKGDLNLMEVSEAEAGSLKEQMGLATTEILTRILEAFADAELRLRDAASKKILLEVTLLRAIEARNAVSLDAVLQQLNALRGQGGSTVIAPVAAPVSSTPATPAPLAAVAPAVVPVSPELPKLPPAHSAKAGGVSMERAELEVLWSKLVDAAGRASPFVRTYLLEAHPVSLERGLFTIGFDPEFDDHRGLVDNSRNHELLQTKLAELGIAEAQLKFVRADAPEGWVRRPAAAPATAPKSKPTVAPKIAAPSKEKPPTPPAFDKEEFKNDPLIQKALEVFKGQIVEIRG